MNAATQIGDRLARGLDGLLGSRSVVPASIKVPLRITTLFWVTKLVSTAMGESLADWLDGNRHLLIAGVGGVVALAAFIVSLRLQFRTTRYVPAVYWFAVAMVATFGTMVADGLHQFLGAPFWATTLFYAIVLAVIFWRWRACEGTLSIHSITTRRRETFYWATVLATFALGTAAGDWTGDSLGLHYLPSAILFAAVITLPAIGFALGANSVAMFWFGYVITRPLGASVADYLDFTKARHGLGIAHPVVWGSLAVVMIVLVAVLAVANRRQARQPAAVKTDGGSRVPSR
jgi:uncharacterized membrane-anchored protein